MASPTTRFWLFWITLIEALGAFFGGVFYSVWGDSLTSAPWAFIMSMPGGGRTLGTILLLSGGLFLAGLQWEHLWPRVVGCAVSGLTYIAVGVALAWVSYTEGDAALNGSFGAWFMLGFLTLTLAAFMWRERYLETQEHRREEADERRSRHA